MSRAWTAEEVLRIQDEDYENWSDALPQPTEEELEQMYVHLYVHLTQLRDEEGNRE